MTAQEKVARAFKRGVPVYVAVSGGKDSLTVLDLCKPYQGKFKLLWANQGFNFPHVEAHIRALASIYGMEEIRLDLMRHWMEHGIPAEVAPAHHFIPGAICKAPKIQPWTVCCLAMISLPLRNFLSDLGEPAVMLHGQRHEDGAPNNGPDGWNVPGVEILSPIADWSTRDVVNYIVENKVALPDHYGEVHTSLDCWCCPALFSLEHGNKRFDYMKREHPDKLAAVLPYLETTQAVARSALDRIDDMIARA